MRRTRRKEGFTLIELMIVVAIVVMLAVLVLIGLNPLEQLKKAHDVGKVNKAKELVSAAESFYAIQGRDPTCDDLFLYGELKSGACTGVTLIGGGGLYQATFDPESKTYQDMCDSGEAPDPIHCTVPDELL